VDFHTIDELLIRNSLFGRYWRKGGNKIEQYNSYLYTVRKSIHVRWVTCHHSMAHPQVADGE
jgi:hypothetical protein